MNMLHQHSNQWINLGLATVAATLVASAPSQAQTEAASAPAPVVVAQSSTGLAAKPDSPGADTTPVHLRGVRAAAAQGPDALRRYIHRTRMIYGFYYSDFAPRE
jgi:hypothetical protein